MLVGEYRTKENQQVLTSVFHDEGYTVTSPLPADEIRPGAYLQGVAATDAAEQPKICVTVISENPSDTTIDCR